MYIHIYMSAGPRPMWERQAVREHSELLRVCDQMRQDETSWDQMKQDETDAASDADDDEDDDDDNDDGDDGLGKGQ